MKRILVILIAAALVFILPACGQEEASPAEKSAASVEALIDAIGSVTLESSDTITAAEIAYNALDEEAKALVTNAPTLTAARTQFEKLLADQKAEEDRIAAEEKAEQERLAALMAEAQRIDDAISAIGDVTPDRESAIAEARALYDNADPQVQRYVKKLATLKAAEETLLFSQAKVVMDLIDDLGKITLNSKKDIDAVRQALAALSPEAAAKVANVAALENAAQALLALQQAEAEKLLKSMYMQKDEEQNLKLYFPKNFPWDKKTSQWIHTSRSFVLPYLVITDNQVTLQMVCNYAGTTGVFFEKIVFCVDGENYYDFFGYFSVNRDHSGSIAWEYVDQDADASDIALLWAIANSKKTTIRFEGDNYARDFSVTDKDKQAIKQILTVYEALGGK